MRPCLVLTVVSDDQGSRCEMQVFDFEPGAAREPVDRASELLEIPPPMDAVDLGYWLPAVLHSLANRYERMAVAKAALRPAGPSFSPVGPVIKPREDHWR